MKRTILVFGISLALAGLLSGVAFAQADVPTRIAEYTGTWEGQWGRTAVGLARPSVSTSDYGWLVDSAIVVGQFVKDGNVYTTPVTYTWAFANGSIGTVKTQGVVADPEGVLRVKLKGDAIAEYTFSDSKSLDGRWRNSQTWLPGFFKKK